MLFEPMTMGPAMAYIVAFGCTTVPISHLQHRRPFKQSGRQTRSYSDISFEFDILANDRLRMDCELVLTATLA